MCGRFALITDGEALATRFNLNTIPADLTPRYNIAPSQSVAAIRAGYAPEVHPSALGR